MAGASRAAAAETGVCRYPRSACPLRGRAAPTRWPLLGEGVANPKCGTCRFFQENDLPGSGWCHHPQRKVSSDVKILVRRSELACRDDWSRSLWQPSTGGAGPDAAVARPSSTGPLLPASAESLRAVLNRDHSGSASAGEDVLLSEGRIVSESQETWEPPPRPFPAGHFDPRTAIFKAREAYREKIRANAVASRQSGAEAPSSAFARGEIDPAAVELVEKTDESREVGPAVGTDRRVAGDDAWPLETPDPASETGDIEVSPGGDRFFDLERDPGPRRPIIERTEPGAEMPSGDVDREGVCAPELSSIVDYGSEDLDVQFAMLARDLPGWFRADLPRVCRACRDFRPGTEGQRGWCANAWAFTHRQLVQEDDIAPCHSAIGDWWVPVDDVWLVAADVSSHGRATPLLDRMIAAESAERRRS